MKGSLVVSAPRLKWERIGVTAFSRGAKISDLRDDSVHFCLKEDTCVFFADFFLPLIKDCTDVLLYLSLIGR